MGITARRMQERMDELGLDQSELARRVGSTPAAINQIVTGKTKNSRFLPKIAIRLGVDLAWLLGMSDERQLIATEATNDDEDTVEIAVISDGYGMGGTFIDENALTVERRKFSRAWLRDFTDSPPELLFVTSGIGDSMTPTIQDRDGVLVDRGDNRLRGGDRLWAISFAGSEMIKRLRPRPDGTVIILSDNKDVSDDVATDGELFIVGRVAAIMRKV